MIGILAGSGSVNFDNRSVTLESHEKVLLNEFKRTGENLIKCQPTDTHTQFTKGGKDIRKVAFYDVEMVSRLGDFRPTKWPQTVLEKHHWILDNTDYIWGLLEGFFDTHGQVGEKPHQRIVFNTKYLEVANFLGALLTTVGIQRPRIGRDKQAREGIYGIVITNIPDLKIFSENIHLKNPDKDAKLDYFRQITSTKARAYRPSQQEIIDEWVRLCQSLGYIPKRNEINQLRKEGETKYSADIYISRFGDGNFVNARENLEKIIAKREAVQETEEEILPEENIQIFP